MAQPSVVARLFTTLEGLPVVALEHLMRLYDADAFIALTALVIMSRKALGLVENTTQQSPNLCIGGLKMYV